MESCEDIIRRDDPDEDIDLARACLALVERVRELEAELGKGGEMMATQYVRICVAVCKDGSWHACGSSNYSDQTCREIAWDCLDVPDVHFAWVTAEVPIPVETEVRGVAEVDD